MSLFDGQDRETMRNAWRVAWRAHLERLPLEPLQLLMSELIAMHPEYQAQMSGDAAEDSGANAFMHLALHLALREQLATDRPRGITAIYGRLCTLAGDAHAAEHRMIEVLAQTLWEAQRAARMPDEQQYLEALRRL